MHARGLKCVHGRGSFVLHVHVFSGCHYVQVEREAGLRNERHGWLKEGQVRNQTPCLSHAQSLLNDWHRREEGLSLVRGAACEHHSKMRGVSAPCAAGAGLGVPPEGVPAHGGDAGGPRAGLLRRGVCTRAGQHPPL